MQNTLPYIFVSFVITAFTLLALYWLYNPSIHPIIDGPILFQIR